MERIDVRLLGPETTAFHLSEPPSALGLDGEPGFEFPVTIDVKARVVGTRVTVSGTVGCRVRLECSRCLEPFESTLRADVAVEFEEGPTPQKDEDVVEDDDADVSWYEAPFIDLGDDLRQILLVAAPPYPVCREDCKGLCPDCGANRNTTACGHGGGEGLVRPFAELGILIQNEHEGHG